MRKTLRQFYNESGGKIFSLSTADGEIVAFFIPDQFVEYKDKNILPTDCLFFRGLVAYFPDDKSVSIYSTESELSNTYEEDEIKYHDHLDIYMVLKDE